MKGLIILPKKFEHSYLTIQRYMPLFKLCEKELGFQIVFVNQIDVDDPRILEKDIIITFKIPQKSHPGCMANLARLDRKVKLLTYHIDVHGIVGGPKSPIFKANMGEIMSRADKILCSYDYAFRKRWPNYVSKYEFFPQFFAPYVEFKSLGINTKPTRKCFLSGATGLAYPLRTYIRRNRDTKQIIRFAHPGYGEAIYPKSLIGMEFIREMHKYFCAVSTASRFEYVGAKYFEIPAAGVLLIANHTPDLDKLGFKDNVHYVQIDKTNVFDKVDYILNHTDEFEHIRRAGRDLVLEQHSEKNRFDRLKEIVNGVVGG